jgi:hypothetical protein
MRTHFIMNFSLVFITGAKVVVVLKLRVCDSSEEIGLRALIKNKT